MILSSLRVLLNLEGILYSRCPNAARVKEEDNAVPSSQEMIRSFGCQTFQPHRSPTTASIFQQNSPFLSWRLEKCLKNPKNPKR